MYSVVIDVRKDTPQDILRILAGVADKAFDNRAGKVKNTSNAPYRFIYRGSESNYGCLEVGMLNLKRQPNFLLYLEAWNWIDEDDPTENEDILALIREVR